MVIFGNVFLQQDLKSYCERRKDDSLMLVKIRDGTWNVLNMQHITPNWKRWDYSESLVVLEMIKEPTSMVIKMELIKYSLATI